MCHLCLVLCNYIHVSHILFCVATSKMCHLCLATSQMCSNLCFVLSYKLQWVPAEQWSDGSRRGLLSGLCHALPETIWWRKKTWRSCWGIPFRYDATNHFISQGCVQLNKIKSVSVIFQLHLKITNTVIVIIVKWFFLVSFMAALRFWWSHYDFCDIAGDKPEEKRTLLRFLLCLADTGQVTEVTDFGHRQIQLPALLHNRASL